MCRDRRRQAGWPGGGLRQDPRPAPPLEPGTEGATGGRLVQVGSTHPDQVIAAMQRWSEEFIERPHWVAGDLPICEGSPTEEDGPFRGVALRRG